ncbi:MAG: 30S ribosomal protein S7 [bacterium]
MPRRKKNRSVRDIGVDPRFNSHLMQKMINVIMQRGKKNIARSIVYGAFDIVAKKVDGDEKKSFALFEKAIGAVKPYVEVKSRRVGGGVYQVPIEVRADRALALALRWIIEAASKRSNKTMGERLASELLDAAEGNGNAIKKKIDVHRMAEANRAFSHYAW